MTVQEDNPLPPLAVNSMHHSLHTVVLAARVFVRHQESGWRAESGALLVWTGDTFTKTCKLYGDKY